MGRACTVCEHPDHDRIDEQLVGGGSFRAVARRFHLGRDALRRHNAAHLAPSLVAASAQSEEDRLAGLLERLERLFRRVDAVMSAGETSRKPALVLAAAKEARAVLETIGRVSGVSRESPQVVVNLLASEDWLRVRGAVMTALGPYPDAARAVAEALSAPRTAVPARGGISLPPAGERRSERNPSGGNGAS